MKLEPGSKAVGTPGTKPESGNYEDEKSEGQSASGYRAMVARANYLCQDRSDIQYTVKELSRGMASPTELDMQQVKWLEISLIEKPRVTTRYTHQASIKFIDGRIGSDYAGCRRIRKSTSGGLIMLGDHVVKSWSTTQAIIALSSGEGDFYSIVKGSSIGLGIKRMLEDLGVNVISIISTDASAAKGITARKGAGKVRLIEVSQ